MKKLKWHLAQWLELRWWKRYLRHKNKHEYLSWKKDYWKNILENIEDVAPVDAVKTICDLGCGPAGIFIAMPQNNITAVDPLLNEYEKQIPFFSKSYYPNVQFVESTMENFSVAAKYDLVFCMNAINHVHDIEKAFDKLKAICTENGTVVISIDVHNYSFFKYLFRLVPGDVLHPYQYDLNEYKSFLENRGMKILKTELLKKEFLFNHYLIVVRR